MPATQQPNVYILTGGGVHVTYMTTGIGGQPSFVYQDAVIGKSFSGDGIRVVADEDSPLVSVSIQVGVDTGYTSFTLIVPRVSLVDGQAAHVVTLGIRGVHRLTMDTPAVGQLDSYHVVHLRGNASFVEP